jgi:hypothetical protein
MSLSIMEIARMHKEFIYKQLNEMEHALLPSSDEDQELVRRAIFSVRNKSVIFERYVPFSQNLYTIVQDVKSPNVTIEFSQGRITCTCPASGLCRHQLAVMLALYQYFDSVQEWTNIWRAKKSVQMSELAEERSPKSWRNLIDEVMKPHVASEKRIEGYAIMTVADMARTRLNRYMPFEREWVPMFKLFCEFGIFIHIMRQNAMATYQDSNQQYYIEYYADKTYEKIESYVDELASQSRLFAIDPFYDELQNMTFEFIQLNTNYPAVQLSVYLILWKKLLSNDKRIKSELDRIYEWQQSLERHDNETTLPPTIQPILALFHMLLDDMQSLEVLLKRIDLREIELYLMIVQYANQLQQFDVSSKILRAMLPHLNQFLNETLSPTNRQQFAYKLDALFEHVTLSDEEEMTLYASLGKYGVLPFSNYLIRKKRYDEWAALHQLYPSSFSYLETCGLKMVLAEAPAVTLPLYHHFAMEELKQKSRMNYKQAVRIWKGMRNASKKAGKTAYFEQYIQIIRTDYKRLRALQEELDKGNF